VGNNLDEEEGRASPKEAKGIAGILKKQDVQVTIAKVFGPNIERIKKHFVCVMTGRDVISDGLDLLVWHYPEVLAEYEKGEERGFWGWRDRSQPFAV
jgi:predicted Fe-Mo cluster-binding NifX family protein